MNEWFYESLAGIQLDDEQSGFSHFIIRPDMLPQLDWATGSIESPFGTISSSWEKTNDKVTLHVTVPPGTNASVYLPFQEGQTIRLNGKISESGSRETERSVFEVASGTYVWEVE
ncbi:MAG: alpha-L-rhamnosidase C-terminal domain-containing protein [Cyclobacteriaceae bacterium]